MKYLRRRSPAVVAIFAAAIASSLLTFVILIVTGWIGLPSGPDVPLQIAVFLSIVFIWAPAFALVPAGILGFVLERPLSRWLIGRRQGGFVEHLIVVIAAALILWLLLRVIVVLMGPQTQLIDLPSLIVFAIVGLCSALSWWFLVVLPGRRS
ncbi:MAG TPA: hypothetical protein VFT40_12820 [Sphingomicrobium sp.]|nr:hypothetical protein [Sphingomicrobium sp.]